MDLDIALGCNSGMDITMTPGAAQATQTLGTNLVSQVTHKTLDICRALW